MSADHFAMFSRKGNRLVARLVRKAKRQLKAGTCETHLYALLADGFDQIESAGHAEVHDTDVREHIALALAYPWRLAYGCLSFPDYLSIGSHPDADADSGDALEALLHAVNDYVAGDPTGLIPAWEAFLSDVGAV